MADKSNNTKYYLFKVVDILVLLIFPPLGLTFVLTSERFSKFGKIMGSIYTIVFLTIGVIIFE